MSARKPQIDTRDAGSTSETFTRPTGAIGFHAQAVNAYTIQIDATGDKAPFAAGEYTMYLDAADIASVKIEDPDSTDTGGCTVIWIMGRTGAQ